MRSSSCSRFAPVLPLGCFLATLACGHTAVRSSGDEPGSVQRVIFSVANKDRQAPVALIEVSVDNVPIIYGAFPPARRGEYLYVSTVLPQERARIEVASRVGEDEVRAERDAILRENAWIVITRMLDLDGRPEVRIEISYEKIWPD